VDVFPTRLPKPSASQMAKLPTKYGIWHLLKSTHMVMQQKERKKERLPPNEWRLVEEGGEHGQRGLKSSH
jgi:hypothetical protein